ncbi:MAG: TonB-dependent receptor [Pseudomonadales bacterium]|nr:TonB-dependent receptor [Pseudomonadales bacterium]
MTKHGTCHIHKEIFFLIPLVFICEIAFSNTSSDDLSILDDSLFELSLEELMSIKVSVSSVQEETIFDTPSTVTVIDRSSIEKYHYTSIEEALDTVAGFDIYQTIIDRNVATARGILQNFYANKILLLIDNIPTWQPIYGEGSLERININDVEKIEVLKGPASVLYGSNAYTGVVNIVLKKPAKNSLSSYARVGEGDLLAAGLSIHHQFENLSFFSSIHSETQESETYQVPNKVGFEFNGETHFDYANYGQKNNLSLGLGYNAHSLYFNQFSYEHSFLGIHPAYVGGGGKNVEHQGHLLHYKYQNALSEQTDIIASLAYEYYKREFPVSPDYSLVLGLAGNRYASEIKLNYLKAQINIEYGMNAELRQSEGYNTFNGLTGEFVTSNLKDDDDVIEWSTFARLKYDIRDLSLLIGSRYTDNEKFGSNLSSRFSGVYTLQDNQSIKMIIGQSFRVPTMFELYFERPNIIGNPDLEPETSTSYELAYLYGGTHVFVQILAYYSIYENLIQRQLPETGIPSQYQNVNDFKGYGSEVELKYEHDATLGAYINYNHVSGVDEDIDNNYRYVPDHTVSFGLSKHFSYFSLSGKGKYISDVEGFLENIPSQFIASINVSKTHAFHDMSLRHVISIDNITNSKMLTPEYIRETENINELVTEDFGTRYSYSIYIDFY